MDSLAGVKLIKADGSSVAAEAATEGKVGLFPGRLLINLATKAGVKIKLFARKTRRGRPR